MRMFIAIKIPEPIKEKIAEFQDKLRLLLQSQGLNREDIKWVEPDNMHITLKFLGEVPEELIEEIANRVNSSINGIKAFNISFSMLGGFPNLKRPRVLWIGIKGGNDHSKGRELLITLMNNLNNKLRGLGFEEESREPVPHITIGRIKRVQSIELTPKQIGFPTHSVSGQMGDRVQGKGFDALTFLADRVYLIKSELTPSGPIYTDIREFRLQKL